MDNTTITDSVEMFWRVVYKLFHGLSDFGGFNIVGPRQQRDDRRRLLSLGWPI